MTSVSSEADIQRNVSELSRRLLEGWVLMTASCPKAECTVPLIKNKEGNSFCISCSEYIDLSTANGVSTPSQQSTPAATNYSQQSAAQSPAYNRQPEAYAQPANTSANMRGSYNSAYAHSTPSNTNTPTPTPTPTTANNNYGGGSASGGGGGGGLREWEDEPVDPVEEARIQAVKDKSDRNSAALAEKMLAGWTLLQESCPNPECAVPLVANREKDMFCVSCELWVVREEDYDPAKHRAMNESAVSGSGGGSGGGSSAPATQQNTSSGSGNDLARPSSSATSTASGGGGGVQPSLLGQMKPDDIVADARMLELERERVRQIRALQEAAASPPRGSGKVTVVDVQPADRMAMYAAASQQNQEVSKQQTAFGGLATPSRDGASGSRGAAPSTSTTTASHNNNNNNNNNARRVVPDWTDADESEESLDDASSDRTQGGYSGGRGGGGVSGNAGSAYRTKTGSSPVSVAPPVLVAAQPQLSESGNYAHAFGGSGSESDSDSVGDLRRDNNSRNRANIPLTTRAGRVSESGVGGGGGGGSGVPVSPTRKRPSEAGTKSAAAAVAALYEKVDACTVSLRASGDVAECMEIVALMERCAAAIASLRGL